MSKIRAVIIALTLAAVFFSPMAAIPKTEKQDDIEKKTEETEKESEKQEEKFFRILDLENEEVAKVFYGDYVKGAIASEMGADFEFEALVAQGVAAFSCALYQQDIHMEADYDFSAAPDKKLGYITEEKAREIYGDAFEEKWGVITSAAEKAMEYVAVYDGKAALTVYHAISSGRTESAENAWSGEVPYLISVESPGDFLSPDYKTFVEAAKEETLNILNGSGAGLSGEYPEEWFVGAEYSSAGYVKSIQIGDATFSGERIRNLFGLRSSAFSVEYKNEKFVFTVLGYGHGVGLSQVGANYMAQNGADFKEIILHYYPGVSLEKYSDIY